MRVENEKGVDIVQALVKTIKQNKEYLGEIDGAIGDGDHGINMAKGFTMAGKRLEEESISKFSEAMEILGEVLVMDIGGSMGPLYGTLFTAMGEACADKEFIDDKAFAEMLRIGKEELSEISTAQVGDKTLWDCLDPAIIAFNQALDNGKDFVSALAEMKQAAHDGWQSTEGMIAKIGRASRLGERSRGVLDAGATSCYLILACLADEFTKKVQASI